MTARPSPLARTRAFKMPISRNLLRRPAKPALNNGPVQRGAERALIAHNGGPITTSIAVEWAYALRRYQGKPIKAQHLVYVRRALDRVADRLKPPPRMSQATESLFAENHEHFFNSIDPKRSFVLFSPDRPGWVGRGTWNGNYEAGACTGHTRSKILRRYRKPASATASSSPTAWARKLPAPGVR